MAKIVLGLASSHTPLLILPAEDWVLRAAADYKNPELNLSDGRYLSYEALKSEVGEVHQADIKIEELLRRNINCQQALDRLANALEAAAPDVVIIVGDDQKEMFNDTNQPAVAIFYGHEVITSNMYGPDKTEGWKLTVGKAYLMDQAHVLPGAPEMALDIISGLLNRDIDISVCARIERTGKLGFGHAFGFIVSRLFRGRSIPVVPLLLNTYYPPNVPSPRRCHDIGKALSSAINASKADLKVAVIASGGLSHFVVDEELDRRVIKGLSAQEAEILRRLPSKSLQSGSSEILNWVLAAGALTELPLSWTQYQPLYRTPAGTGVGAGFAIWASP
jgi:hypothetical protein